MKGNNNDDTISHSSRSRSGMGSSAKPLDNCPYCHKGEKKAGPRAFTSFTCGTRLNSITKELVVRGDLCIQNWENEGGALTEAEFRWKIGPLDKQEDTMTEATIPVEVGDKVRIRSENESIKSFHGQEGAVSQVIEQSDGAVVVKVLLKGRINPITFWEEEIEVLPYVPYEEYDEEPGLTLSGTSISGEEYDEIPRAHPPIEVGDKVVVHSDYLPFATEGKEVTGVVVDVPEDNSGMYGVKYGTEDLIFEAYRYEMDLLEAVDEFPIKELDAVADNSQLPVINPHFTPKETENVQRSPVASSNGSTSGGPSSEVRLKVGDFVRADFSKVGFLGDINQWDGTEGVVEDIHLGNYNEPLYGIRFEGEDALHGLYANELVKLMDWQYEVGDEVITGDSEDIPEYFRGKLGTITSRHRDQGWDGYLVHLHGEDPTNFLFHSDELEAPKFKVGDKVRVVKTGATGRLGTVEEILASQPGYQVKPIDDKGDLIPIYFYPGELVLESEYRANASAHPQVAAALHIEEIHKSLEAPEAPVCKFKEGDEVWITSDILGLTNQKAEFISYADQHQDPMTWCVKLIEPIQEGFQDTDSWRDGVLVSYDEVFSEPVMVEPLRPPVVEAIEEAIKERYDKKPQSKFKPLQEVWAKASVDGEWVKCSVIDVDNPIWEGMAYLSFHGRGFAAWVNESAIRDVDPTYEEGLSVGMKVMVPYFNKGKHVLVVGKIAEFDINDHGEPVTWVELDSGEECWFYDNEVFKLVYGTPAYAVL